MGRPQQPLDRDGTPLTEFAIRLRDLRDRADLTYDQLARKTTFARGTIHEAMRGRRLPSRDVTRAIVTACGGDARDWEAYRLRVKRAPDELGVPVSGRVVGRRRRREPLGGFRHGRRS